MKILFLLLIIITLSLPNMTYAKSLYDVEMVNEYTGNTEKNKDRIEKILEKLTNAANIKERIMINCLKPYPEFACPNEFKKTQELAKKVVDPGVKMGEGWLLPGEVCELIEKGYNSVVCAQPFGCLPNHIVGKGTIRRLRELYPNANIFPVDYDAGASKVNQENRIKLMLAMADEL